MELFFLNLQKGFCIKLRGKDVINARKEEYDVKYVERSKN